MVEPRNAVVFVHGVFSSGSVWNSFKELLIADSELSGVDFCLFEYDSPKFSVNPKKAIPNFNTIADSLQTYLETELSAYRNVVLVSHSQGGLVVQRYLARMLSAGRGHDLRRIRRIIMFACPNAGSARLLNLRRRIPLWSHAQERQLRPLNEEVSSARSAVINRIVHAQVVGPDRCPIPMWAYAGMSDNIVTPQSAKDVFPNVGVIPGDHSSIIQPDSSSHRSYTTLRNNLLAALSSAPSEPAEPMQLLTSTEAVEQLYSNLTGQSPTLDQSSERVVVEKRWSSEQQVSYVIIRPEGLLEWSRDDESGDGREA